MAASSREQRSPADQLQPVSRELGSSGERVKGGVERTHYHGHARALYPSRESIILPGALPGDALQMGSFSGNGILYQGEGKKREVGKEVGTVERVMRQSTAIPEPSFWLVRSGDRVMRQSTAESAGARCSENGGSGDKKKTIGKLSARNRQVVFLRVGCGCVR